MARNDTTSASGWYLNLKTSPVMLCVVLPVAHMTCSTSLVRFTARTRGGDFRHRPWITTTPQATVHQLTAAAGGTANAVSFYPPTPSLPGIAPLTTTGTVQRVYTWWSNCSESARSLLLHTSVWHAHQQQISRYKHVDLCLCLSLINFSVVLDARVLTWCHIFHDTVL